MSAMQNVLKLCAAGGMSLVLVAGAAFAAPREIQVTAQVDPDTRVERVSYKDLNLVFASHQKMLNTRVGRAVHNVCGTFDYGLGGDDRACKSMAWSGARPQIRLAIDRAREIAATGSSSIPPVAIVLAFPSR